jgi:hypothetical protein
LASMSFVPKRQNLGRTMPCRYYLGKDHACWRDGPSSQSSWSCSRTTFCSDCTGASPCVLGDRPPSTHECAPKEIPHWHACICGPRLRDRHPPNWPPQHRHRIQHRHWCSLQLRCWSFPSSLSISEQAVQDSVWSQTSVWTP